MTKKIQENHPKALRDAGVWLPISIAYRDKPDEASYIYAQDERLADASYYKTARAVSRKVRSELWSSIKRLGVEHGSDEVWVGIELGEIPAIDARATAGKPGTDLPGIILKDTYSELAGASSWIYSADELMQTIMRGGGRIRKFGDR